MTPLPEGTPTGNAIQIKLDGARGFIPNITTIKPFDEVVWENIDSYAVTLVSNDRLFEANLLAFYQQYRYIFTKEGSYTFTIKNKNLTGTIIVKIPATQTPAPSATPSRELPSTALYVTARMEKLTNWSTNNELKYELASFKVDVLNQINIPLTIKAQILSEDQILEETSFNLETQGSSVRFTNEKKHFINNTNVSLRLLTLGYPPIDYKFTEVDQLN
jgi:plastocyanin